jgi:hypothetical protein
MARKPKADLAATTTSQTPAAPAAVTETAPAAVTETAPAAVTETAPAAIAQSTVLDTLLAASKHSSACSKKTGNAADAFEFEPTQGPKESDQQYFERVIRAIVKLPEDDPADKTFDEMGDAAVNWFNSAVDQFKAKKPIVPPAGYVPPAGAEPKKRGNEAGRSALAEFNRKRREEKAAAAQAAGTASAVGTDAATKTAAKAAKAAAKAPAPSKPREVNENGAVWRLRRHFLEDSSQTAEKLGAWAVEAGITTSPNTVSSVISDTTQTLRILKLMGKQIVDLPKAA